MPIKALDDRKILLVGELNPYGADPEMALYPLPVRASGARLQRLFSLSLTDYLHGHDRVNLCTRIWSLKKAREKARELVTTRQPGTGVVLCGAQVAGAFDLPFQPGVSTHNQPSGLAFLVIPHPSGANRMWNDGELSGQMYRAYESLRKHVGLELRMPRPA